MNQKGFTYILALTLVMVMGIMLGMVGQSWQMLKKREQEEELLFRGNQVVDIFNQRADCKNLSNLDSVPLWSIDWPKGNVLEVLVQGIEEKCNDGGMSIYPRKFRLRKSATIDPTTQKEWKLLTKIGDTSLFAGVASTSSDEPLKKGGFPDGLPDFNDKKKYSEWEFNWELMKKRRQMINQSIQVNLPGP